MSNMTESLYTIQYWSQRSLGARLLSLNLEISFECHIYILLYTYVHKFPQNITIKYIVVLNYLTNINKV